MRYAPMLAQKISHVPTGEEWVIEPKYDGWRALALTDAESVRLETRTGNPITQVPYLAAALAASVPPGTILDGEIVDLTSEREWNRTQTILSTTRGGYQHEPCAEDPALTYVLFDILALAGTDLRDLILAERKQHLAELIDSSAGIGSGSGVLTLAPMESASKHVLETILAQGFEGAVIKHRYSRYLCGARGGGAWYKLKPDTEIEAVCTGFYPPEPGSKYAPLDEDRQAQPWAVGGLCFSVEHDDGRVYAGRAAGMDDELRRAMHENPSQFIGLVVEIAHRGIEDSGALRHPQFKRFRARQEKPRRRLGPARATKLSLDADPLHAIGGCMRELARTSPTRAAATGVLEHATSTRATQAASSGKSPGSTPRSASSKRSRQGAALGGKRRMRNYRAMRDAKLHACRESLRARSGDAYERCVNAGSGDPNADLAEVEHLARERELS
jgi:ATP-dependent DNA ligase